MLDLKHAEADEAAECAGEQCAAEEEGDAEPEFAAGVEERKVEDHTREEAGFKGTEEKADHKHASEVVGGTLEESHGTPADHHCSGCQSSRIPCGDWE